MKTREEIFARIYSSLSNGIRVAKSAKARLWLKEKGLTPELTFACFNSGQMHHRKPQEYLDELESVGFLKKAGVNSRTKEKQSAYTSFSSYAIMFPLRNKKNEIINLYSIRLGLQKEQTEYLNQEGIYPGYPNGFTKKLYITSTVLDAASLIQSKVLDNREAVMSLFDGELKEQHIQAIAELKHLQEIIFIKNTNE